MTAPSYNTENRGSERLRKCPVIAYKGQESESNQGQSGPRTHAFSTHLLPTSPPRAFYLLCMGFFSSPSAPTKLLRLQVLLCSPQMLSLHLGSGAQVKGHCAICHSNVCWWHTYLAGPWLKEAGCHPAGRHEDITHTRLSQSPPNSQFSPVELLQKPAPFQLWKGFWQQTSYTEPKEQNTLEKYLCIIKDRAWSYGYHLRRAPNSIRKSFPFPLVKILL